MYCGAPLAVVFEEPLDREVGAVGVDAAPGRLVVTGVELQGGVAGEVQGRCRGDAHLGREGTGKVQGRYREGAGEMHTSAGGASPPHGASSLSTPVNPYE